jgi:hypothetical protein
VNLVAYEFGQVLQLIRMEETRPHSGTYLPDLLVAIRERYKFVTAPTNFTEAGLTEGAKFEMGALQTGNRLIAIKSLGVFKDGLLISCWNTEDAEFITDEFMDWSIKTFGLRKPTTSIPRKYSSQLVVDFDVSIDHLMTAFSAVCRAYESALEDVAGIKVDMHVEKLILSSDPIGGLPTNQTSFSIETRVNVPFSERRYFSVAPLTSAGHLKFLANLENLLQKAT